MRPSKSRTAAAGECGFSLVEVVVALAILAVVATAALGFFTRTLAANVALQHRETAVTLANAAMEQVRAVDPAWGTPTTTSTTGTTSGTTGTSSTTPGLPSTTAAGTVQRQGLAAGRDRTAVDAAWAASSSPEKSLMVPAWDDLATAESTRAVPITSPPTRVSDQTFTTTVLVGTCGRARGSATADCTAAVTGSDVVLLQRVVVEVSWTPVAGSCPTGGCVYRTSALVDPHADASWLVTS